VVKLVVKKGLVYYDVTVSGRNEESDFQWSSWWLIKGLVYYDVTVSGRNEE